MADKSIVSNSKLTAIANAIRSKTGSTENLTLDNMVTKIQSISGAGSGEDRFKTFIDNKGASYLFQYYKGTSVEDLISYNDTENVTDMTSMFYNCTNLQTIPELNTSNVTNMYGMFEKCTNLQTIPELNTSNVTNMSNMFYNCTNLQTIPELNTSKIADMEYMFNACNKLQTIPKLDTSNVNKMSYMFRYCENLQTIDITSMDKITSTSSSNYMCRNCYSLTKFIIRTMTVIPALNSSAFNSCYHFTGTVNSTYNPEGLKDGRIYVPDNMVEQLKSATNWSAYADIIVPLSTLQEE